MMKKLLNVMLCVPLLSGLSVGSSAAEKNVQPQTAVVYFSASGTTRTIAQRIAAVTGGDLMEIVPQQRYTSADLNYRDDNSRANREMHHSKSRPAFENTLSAVSGYKKVFLGYPIWWGTAPRIIQTFLESYDLSEASIYLFCTSGGSGIEESVADLQWVYPKLKIVTGKRLNRASSSEIKSWIDTLE